MFTRLKHKMRRRLFGGRMHQRLLDDRRVLGRLANLHYQTLSPGIAHGEYLPAPEDFEFSCYSQNGEDGIILSLLSRIGVENHYIVEIGTEDGRECNSANMILNFGWHACLIECDPGMAQSAVGYFQDSAGGRVRVMHALATPENINDLLAEGGVPRQVDILSIDIDSHDYWLWQAVQIIEPRLVVIEYNASFGPALSVTIPYGEPPPLTRLQTRYYQGASLKALQRLGLRKGYQLVAGDSKGVNAFFVRQDVCETAGLHAASPAQVYRPHFRRSLKKSPEEQLRIISGFTLTEVG